MGEDCSFLQNTYTSNSSKLYVCQTLICFNLTGRQGVAKHQLPPRFVASEDSSNENAGKGTTDKKTASKSKAKPKKRRPSVAVKMMNLIMITHPFMMRKTVTMMMMAMMVQAWVIRVRMESQALAGHPVLARSVLLHQKGQQRRKSQPAESTMMAPSWSFRLRRTLVRRMFN